jgi:hypothetical protein
MRAARTVRQTVSLPSNLATHVRSLAKLRMLGANRMLVELIENGINAEKRNRRNSSSSPRNSVLQMTRRRLSASATNSDVESLARSVSKDSARGSAEDGAGFRRRGASALPATGGAEAPRGLKSAVRLHKTSDAEDQQLGQSADQGTSALTRCTQRDDGYVVKLQAGAKCLDIH